MTKPVLDPFVDAVVTPLGESPVLHVSLHTAEAGASRLDKITVNAPTRAESEEDVKIVDAFNSLRNQYLITNKQLRLAVAALESVVADFEYTSSAPDQGRRNALAMVNAARNGLQAVAKLGGQ